MVTQGQRFSYSCPAATRYAENSIETVRVTGRVRLVSKIERLEVLVHVPELRAGTSGAHILPVALLLVAFQGGRQWHVEKSSPFLRGAHSRHGRVHFLTQAQLRRRLPVATTSARVESSITPRESRHSYFCALVSPSPLLGLLWVAGA